MERRGRGRPATGNNFPAVVRTRIDNATRDAVEADAAARGVSVARALREAIAAAYGTNTEPREHASA